MDVAALLHLAEDKRRSQQELLHFAWIGPLNESRWKQGIATAANRLARVSKDRLVFWTETQNYETARAEASRIDGRIQVMTMRDLFRHWEQSDAERAQLSRHVYATLKRLDTMSAAKDLSSLCILYIVGGYFFDASVEFCSYSEVMAECGSRISSGDWKVATTEMPCQPGPLSSGDAWALYAPRGAESTRKAIDAFNKKAGENGFQRRQFPPGQTHPLTGLTDPGSAYNRVGSIIDMIMTALPTGWGQDEFRQVQIRSNEGEENMSIAYFLPDLGLKKVCASSTFTQDPSKYTGWKARPLRDWTKKNVY